MKHFAGKIHAEIIKMKHTFLVPFHVAAIVLGSGLFLMYYRFSGWDELSQISAYVEMIGVALPFVISIVCAGNIGLEEQNHFQILLGSYTKKWQGIVVKWLTLSGMGFLTIGGAVVIFGTGYHFFLGKEGISADWYMLLVVILFLGSIPLYLEHLFLNLLFPRAVSQCAGVAQTVLSALFLTGLGDGRWQFFPSTWSARGIGLALSSFYQEKMERAYFYEIKKTIFICPLYLVLICAIIAVGFHYYEGRQCND